METHDNNEGQPEGWPKNDIPATSGAEINGSDTNDPFAKAAAAFAAEDHKPGDAISRQHFHALLGVQAPPPGMPWEQAEKLKLDFLGAFERFRALLLIDHNTALRPVVGYGYSVVAPGKQSSWALEKFNDDLAGAFSKGIARATYVQTAGLTLGELNEQQAVLSQLASLQGHIRAARLKARRDRAALRSLGRNGDSHENGEG